MNPEELITKVTQVLQREDGSEVRMVATAMFGRGLKRSIDLYVHRRDSAESKWILCNDKPHPDSKSMSVDEYVKFGRPEVFQLTSFGERVRLTSLIGQPMSALH